MFLCIDPLPARCDSFVSISDALHSCEGGSLIYFVSFMLFHLCFDCIDPLPTRCLCVRFDPLPTLCVSDALHLCEGGSLIYFVSFIDSLVYSCFDCIDPLPTRCVFVRFDPLPTLCVFVRSQRFA